MSVGEFSVFLGFEENHFTLNFHTSERSGSLSLKKILR